MERSWAYRFVYVALALLPSATLALEFGEFSTANGSQITVEEDFMNAQYPRHVIGLAAQGREDEDGWLVLRCQENVTEVFFASGPFEFFGHGTSPVVNVRFPSESQATRQTVSLSNDSEAVFFEDPVDFIVKVMEDGSVGMNGGYYNSSFRHNFVLDDESIAAIRDLATTCGWVDRLPAYEQASVQPTAPDEVASEVRRLVEEYGEDAVREAITQVLPEK